MIGRVPKSGFLSNRLPDDPRDWPAPVLRVVQCPACGRGLVRTANGFACPVLPWHGPITPDNVFAERLDAVLPVDSRQKASRTNPDLTPRAMTIRRVFRLAKRFAALGEIPDARPTVPRRRKP